MKQPSPTSYYLEQVKNLNKNVSFLLKKGYAPSNKKVSTTDISKYLLDAGCTINYRKLGKILKKNGTVSTRRSDKTYYYLEKKE